MAAQPSQDAYDVDDDPARIDLDVLWNFLSTDAYWARWRTRDVVEAQVRTAWRIVGAYERHTGAMVGFARAFSDGFSHAYLADVFVLPAHQGRGVGTRLVAEMIERGPGAHFVWMLHTRDAQALYARFGFGPRQDGRYMERPPQRG